MKLKQANFLRDTFFLCIFLLCSESVIAQKKYPLAGKWSCITSPIKIPAIGKFPSGVMVQKTAHASDEYGQWNSNSYITYTPDTGQGAYTMKTTAKGLHIMRGTALEEVVLRFEILKPMDQSSLVAVNYGRTINRLLMLLMQKSMHRKYQLRDITDRSYVLEPWKKTDRSQNIRSSCVLVGR